MNTGPYVSEVHGKARVLHDQIAALTAKAAEAGPDAHELTALFCAPYYQLLDELFAEELPWANAMDSSDMVVRLKGPAADQDAPRVSLLTDVLGLLRKQVQGIAKALMQAHGNENFPDTLDLGLSAFARGSIVLGLKVRSEPSGQQSLLGENDLLFDATRSAVHRLGEVSRFLDEGGVHDDIVEALPDPALRDVVLSAASKLAPTGRRGIDTVQLVHPGATWGDPMTPATRVALRQALTRPIKRRGFFEATGVVRELDLDLMRFELRNVREIGSIRCVYAGIPESQARALLGATVVVAGDAALDVNGRAKLMQISDYKILAASDAQGELPLRTESL